MFSTCLFFLAYLEGVSGLKPVVSLEPLPEANGFLQRPGDMAVGENGDIYVLDLGARAVYVWNKSGAFKTAFGKRGQGPGEFQFTSRVGGAQGFISITTESIYIYDGGNQVLNRFGRNHDYQDSQPYRFFSGGSVENLKALDENRFLVFYSSYFSEVPHRKAAVYDEDNQLVRQFAELEEKTWHYFQKDGGRKVMIHGYAPNYGVVYNEANGEVLMLDGSRPAFEVYDRDGKLRRTVEMKLTRKSVEKQDIEEYDSRSLFQNQNFFHVSYAENKPYYDRVLPLGTDRYLVFLESPVENICEGMIVDAEGHAQTSFKIICGEGGGLRGTRGQVFAQIEDDLGELQIVRLSADR